MGMYQDKNENNVIFILTKESKRHILLIKREGNNPNLETGGRKRRVEERESPLEPENAEQTIRQEREDGPCMNRDETKKLKLKHQI